MADALAALRARTGLSLRELMVLDQDTIAALVEDDINEDLVWRVRRVRRLRRDLGLQYEAIEIIIRLLDRIEDLERRRV